MQLAKREKFLISLAVIVIAVVLVAQLAVVPFINGRDRFRSSVAVKQRDLQEMQALRQEYLTLQRESDVVAKRLADRPKSFTLFSFLEKAAGDAGVKDNIKYMKPSDATVKGSFKESLVEMKLERITLGQMVDYLQLIESPAQLVSIKRISIQSNKEETQYLDAILQVLTFTQS